MFEIATQFNAIFRAQQTSHIANGGSAAGSNPNNNGQASVSLLSMWISRRIHSFLKILGSQLQLMDESGSLRDALDACIFFTGSMGRLGADFTAQLPPLFEQRLLAIVLKSWKEGINQLAETLKVCRDAGVASSLVSSTVVAGAPSSGTDADGDDEAGQSSSSGIMMPPPRKLMEFPPLGRLVNACLSGLNELRRCLLPGVYSQLRGAIEQDFLNEVKNILHAHERAVMTPGLRGDVTKLRSIAKEMKNVTKTIIFPYVRGALELSLGNESGAKLQFDKVRKVLAPPPPPPKPAEPIANGEDGEEDGTPAATTTTNESMTPPVVSNTPNPGVESLKES